MNTHDTNMCWPVYSLGTLVLLAAVRAAGIVGGAAPSDKEQDHRSLLLAEGRRRDLSPSQEEINRAVGALRRRFTDLKSFGRWMAERGLDERTLFDSVRDELLVAKTRAAVSAGAPPTPEQVRAYYDEHRASLKAGEEVRLRIIALKRDAEARDVLAALARGARFEDQARRHSVGSRAEAGGDVGWVTVATLPRALREKVTAMPVGTVAGPVARGTDVVVVRVEGRRRGRPLTLAEAEPQILAQLRALHEEERIAAWLAARGGEP